MLLGHSSLVNVQIYARLAGRCFGDQEYDVVEIRDSHGRPEAISRI